MAENTESELGNWILWAIIIALLVIGVYKFVRMMTG
ncbi:Uncharacterised protein [uncultured archaeon]|nr:Uncharacterised protein [uncultured archaeon]